MESYTSCRRMSVSVCKLKLESVGFTFVKTFHGHIFLAVSHILGSTSHLLQGLSAKRFILGINCRKIIANILRNFIDTRKFIIESQ